MLRSSNFQNLSQICSLTREHTQKYRHNAAFFQKKVFAKKAKDITVLQLHFSINVLLQRPTKGNKDGEGFRGKDV